MDNKTDWQISKTSLAERFIELHKLKEWADCTFSVGYTDIEVIKCHKLVLAASSPVFEALFYGSLSTCDKLIRVPDLEPETFKLLLRYMYCDTIELDTILDAGKLLYASKKYMLHHLSRKCLDYIIQHLQIMNFWEVLDVAETLNEEELMDSCLKVMRQYRVSFWSSPNEHLSKTVLSRLLDQDSLNTPEVELWKFILSWAEMECQLNNIQPTPTNIRAIIDDIGLLKKIRFLTFTERDLYELVEPTGIISNSELTALNRCIDSMNHNRNDNTCDISCDKLAKNCNNNSSMESANKFNNNVILPDVFNNNCHKRLPILVDVNYCSRKILTKKKSWFNGGTWCTKVSSQTHALITGFEVLTRIACEMDFRCTLGALGLYNERLMLQICDDEGTELVKMDYTGVAEFNASQNIKLMQPIWFYPKRQYKVILKLSEGQYPLSQLSAVASCKIVVFNFEDCTNRRVGPDFGFICGVIFSF